MGGRIAIADRGPDQPQYGEFVIATLGFRLFERILEARTYHGVDPLKARIGGDGAGRNGTGSELRVIYGHDSTQVGSGDKLSYCVAPGWYSMPADRWGGLP
ncbi:hypothetical protein GCM10011505_02020 [Tistrella bauzanensis]|uniref:Uncharacterized protein n=1 Tax=Tistrella bauzanensis TaxID=657419 RepID=A0ABQ1I7G0_9PROT|nr:hypothetical protein GCM10011505_02020 [Tistrella bauzanensis]